MRTCSKCGVEKPLDDFEVTRRKSDGYAPVVRGQCRECRRAYMRSYQAAHKAETAARSKSWKERNRDRAVANNAAWHERHKAERNAAARAAHARRVVEDPAQRMILVGRSNAKRAGIEHSITREDLVIPDVCPVLGIPIRLRYEPGGRGGARADSPSIDRIDPRKGYVRGNVRVMSHRANTLLGDATIEELEAVLAFLRAHPRPV